MDSNLRRLAGVSAAGDRCRNPERAQRVEGPRRPEIPCTNGRPEWIRTIDLFRVKNEVVTLKPFPHLAFPLQDRCEMNWKTRVLMAG